MPITTNVPSNNFLDLKRDVEDATKWVNGSEPFQNRLGDFIKPIKQISSEAETIFNEQFERFESYRGLSEVGDFTSGFTITSRPQIALFNGEWYRWDGTLPKIVQPGSTPNITGGTGQGAWLSVGDAALRNSLASSSSDTPVGGVQARQLRLIDGIKNLISQPNIVMHVRGFFSGSNIGGGDFHYNPTLSQALHNGGTIIANAALAAWDGTKENLSTLLNWTGNGAGCFVKAEKGYVTPEDFGALGNGTSSDTISFNAAINISNNILARRGANYLVGRLNAKNGLVLDLNGATLTRDVVSLIGGVSGNLTNSGIFYVTNSTVKNVTIKNGAINDRFSQDVTKDRSFIVVGALGCIDGWSLLNLDFKDSKHGVLGLNSLSLAGDYSIIGLLVRDCKMICEIEPDRFGVVFPYTVFQGNPFALVGVCTARDCVIENCQVSRSYHAFLFYSDVAVANYPPKNNRVSGCRVEKTLDTSIYFFGEGNVAENNHVILPGKDGIKTNTKTFQLSKGNRIINNTFEGLSAQYQADGSAMILSAGESDIISNNTYINVYSTGKASYTQGFIVVSGGDSIVSNNLFKTDKTNVKVFTVGNDNGYIGDNKAVMICDNHFVFVDGTSAATGSNNDIHQLKDVIFRGNYLYNFRLAIGAITPAAPFFTNRGIVISDNEFDGNTPTLQYIFYDGVEGIVLNNNIFTGIRARDIQSETNGVVIGKNNRTDGGATQRITTSYGPRHSGIPTRGTFHRGDVVSDNSQGWICTSPGTFGTLAGATADTSSGSFDINVSGATGLGKGHFITLAGESGHFIVQKRIGSVLTLNRQTTNSATGIALSLLQPTFSAPSPFLV